MNVKKRVLTKSQEGNIRTKAMSHTSKLLNRVALFASGEESYINSDGKEIPIKPMTSQELKAAEIVLRKTLPDLSAVQEVKSDELEGMGRDDLAQMLANVISANPALANLPELQTAVSEANTVLTVVPRKMEDG